MGTARIEVARLFEARRQVVDGSGETRVRYDIAPVGRADRHLLVADQVTPNYRTKRPAGAAHDDLIADLLEALDQRYLVQD